MLPSLFIPPREASMPEQQLTSDTIPDTHPAELLPGLWWVLDGDRRRISMPLTSLLWPVLFLFFSALNGCF